MKYIIPFNDESEIESIVTANSDKRLSEIQEIVTGNFLIFSDFTISKNKEQITADGIDTLDMAISVNDKINPQKIEILVDNGEVIELTTNNGTANFQMTTTFPGIFDITLKNYDGEIIRTSIEGV